MAHRHNKPLHGMHAALPQSEIHIKAARCCVLLQIGSNLARFHRQVFTSDLGGEVAVDSSVAVERRNL